MTCYNDNNPFAAEWLRRLIQAGLIANGIVDERSIADVRGEDLAGYRRVHLFAGIGGWDYALQLAGWPTDRTVWTGSCPCQPFSVTGKRRGTEDERHLWPHMLRLISECRPPVVFGEQVASKDGREWLSRVRADLEALGYAVGAADLCAAGVGAPHIRQRLFWVADTTNSDWRGRECEEEAGIGPDCEWRGRPTSSSTNLRVADTDHQPGESHETHKRHTELGRPGETLRPARVGDAHSRNKFQQAKHTGAAIDASQTSSGDGWVPFAVLCGTDTIARRIEPGVLPLAYGIPRSVAEARSGLAGMGEVSAGTLREASQHKTGTIAGYGNAIVPQVAALFIRAYMDTRCIEDAQPATEAPQ